MEYNINDIQAISKTTKQSLYKLMKSNSELCALMEEHKITRGKNTFYDEVIYDWFRKYYASQKNPVELNDVAGGNSESAASENHETTPAPSVDYREILGAKDALIEHLRRQVESLEANIESMRGELSEKQQDLNNKEAERIHFITECDKLTNLLAAEKQEKNKLLLMLPPPRATIREKIKALFTKSKQGEKGAKEDE